MHLIYVLSGIGNKTILGSLWPNDVNQNIAQRQRICIFEHNIGVAIDLV